MTPRNDPPARLGTGPADPPTAPADLTALLAAVAESAPLGPAPVAAVLSGGRRRRLRRRAVIAGVVAAVVLVAGGGTLAAPDGFRRGAPASPADGPTASLLPVHTKLAEGDVAAGHWEAWATLWPAAGRERAAERAELMRVEELATHSSTMPTGPDEHLADSLWVNFHLTLNGERMPKDFTWELPPDRVTLTRTPPEGGLIGDVLPLRADPADGAPPWVRFAAVAADATRVVVRGPDGSTVEPTLYSLGDPRVRWFALAVTDQLARSYSVYGTDNQRLGFE
ncbi:hypothetical protein ACIRBX_33410 [Kitasatospora sp. NPDC096147]|uniref:hypothetical protein n=1 Tax=Kitasatospora sp. NPDC096147 TaxID=3364093 RepID=UPI003823D43F